MYFDLFEPGKDQSNWLGHYRVNQASIKNTNITNFDNSEIKYFILKLGMEHGVD